MFFLRGTRIPCPIRINSSILINLARSFIVFVYVIFSPVFASLWYNTDFAVIVSVVEDVATATIVCVNVFCVLLVQFVNKP